MPTTKETLLLCALLGILLISTALPLLNGITDSETQWYIINMHLAIIANKPTTDYYQSFNHTDSFGESPYMLYLAIVPFKFTRNILTLQQTMILVKSLFLIAAALITYIFARRLAGPKAAVLALSSYILISLISPVQYLSTWYGDLFTSVFLMASLLIMADKNLSLKQLVLALFLLIFAYITWNGGIFAIVVFLAFLIASLIFPYLGIKTNNYTIALTLTLIASISVALIVSPRFLSLGFIPFAVLLGIFLKSITRNKWITTLTMAIFFFAWLYLAELAIFAPFPAINMPQSQQALTWLSSHTPPNATFLTNENDALSAEYYSNRTSYSDWWGPNANANLNSWYAFANASVCNSTYLRAISPDYLLIGAWYKVPWLHGNQSAQCQGMNLTIIYYNKAIRIFKVVP